MRKSPELKIIGDWEGNEGEVQTCLVVDVPLVFDFGGSWRHSTELIVFSGGVREPENQNFGVQNTEISIFFALWPTFSWHRGKGTREF